MQHDHAPSFDGAERMTPQASPHPINGASMTASQKLAIARKITLLLDGEEVKEVDVRVEILLIAARGKASQMMVAGLAAGTCSFR